jgi:tRNA threonylcarbamoyladenosine biosynthesis protein TsaB
MSSRLLLIETATATCSVALADGGVVMEEKVVREGFRHAENLMVLVDDLIKSHGGYSTINGIAVSAGPGSYTGLRIGLSSAKGIAYALEIPIILLSTLEIMAEGFRRCFPSETGYLIPMLDARRMEVYTACFYANGKRHMPDSPLILDDNAYANLDFNAEQCFFFGDGAAKWIAGCNYPKARFDLQPDWHACDMANLAEQAWGNQQFADLAYSEPEYLKPFFTTAKPVE